MLNKREEDEESKEIEQINKIIENNLKLEYILNAQTKVENPTKNYDWKILEDQTYQFIQNIDTLWEFIKSLMGSSQFYPLAIKENSHFWNLGDIFTGKLNNSYDFEAKVIKKKESSEFKKIGWIINIETGENILLNLSLYKITEDNSSVLQLILKYIPSFRDNIRNSIKEEFKLINCIKNIENKLKKEPVYLTQYESGILLGTINGIWDIMTDKNKLDLVAPNNDCFVPININKTKVGDTSIVPMKIKNCSGYLEIKLDYKDNNPDLNEWAFSYSIIGGEPFRIVRQTVIVQLTKINKSETQLSVFTKIYDKINMHMLKTLSHKKKYVLSSLKDYFENFYSPENDQNDINN